MLIVKDYSVSFRCVNDPPSTAELEVLGSKPKQVKAMFEVLGSKPQTGEGHVR